MSEFTPGPWTADGYHVRQSGAGGNRMVADVCYTGPHHTPPEDYPKSCRLQDEANARLIASAPDLYEALKKMVESPYVEANHHLAAALFAHAEKVLAKADGKEGA